MSNDDTTNLQEQWAIMYKNTLPGLAQKKSPSQPHWPVHLDHCFARIVLDAVVGRGETVEAVASSSSHQNCPTPGPWTDHIRSPATKNMNSHDLQSCIALGEAIAAGSVDLVELDNKSLKFRGKSKPGALTAKRPHMNEANTPRKAIRSKRRSPATEKPRQLVKPQRDIRKAFGGPEIKTSAPASIDPDLRAKIESSDLTEYRKRVLLTLCQIPKGQVSTYLVSKMLTDRKICVVCKQEIELIVFYMQAMSNFLHSSPRAVGNALRNNPFAPHAPCHRIIAADKGIGGFGGSWGTTGIHYAEKVRLLRQEGVKIHEKEGRVPAPIWSDFK